MPKRSFALVLLAGLAFIKPTIAGGLPVIDSANVQQAILQLMEAKKQLDVLNGQYQALQQQVRALTGPGNVQGLLSGNIRAPWMTLTQEQLIDMMRQGLLPGNLEHRREYLARITPTLPPEAITPHNPASSRAQFYTHHAETTLAGQATLSGQRQNLVNLQDTTFTLNSVIDQQEGIKDAIDLNNAMISNLSQILIETARSSNVSADQVALINQLIVDSANSDARFFGTPGPAPSSPSAVASVGE